MDGQGPEVGRFFQQKESRSRDPNTLMVVIDFAEKEGIVASYERLISSCQWLFANHQLLAVLPRQRPAHGFVQRGLGFGVLFFAELALLAVDFQLEELFFHRLQKKR